VESSGGRLTEDLPVPLKAEYGEEGHCRQFQPVNRQPLYSQCSREAASFVPDLLTEPLFDLDVHQYQERRLAK